MEFNNEFLQGPELPSLTDPAKKLAIFLHGYGSHGHDLIELAPYMQDSLPEISFLSPNGLEICELGGFGYQWFSLQNRDPEILNSYLTEATPKIIAYIEEQLSRFNLGYEDLILIGFSQGTMTALHLAQHMPQIHSVIGFSGAMIKYQNNNPEKTPICLIHGEEDDIVPAEESKKTFEILQREEVISELHLLKNLNHSIDMKGLNLAVNFINNR